MGRKYRSLNSDALDHRSEGVKPICMSLLRTIVDLKSHEIRRIYCDSYFFGRDRASAIHRLEPSVIDQVQEITLVWLGDVPEEDQETMTALPLRDACRRFQLSRAEVMTVRDQVCRLRSQLTQVTLGSVGA
jgi:hypothetical protein